MGILARSRIRDLGPQLALIKTGNDRPPFLGIGRREAQTVCILLATDIVTSLIVGLFFIEERIMETLQDGVEPLNRLLRGELSAVETYQQALESVSSQTAISELERISSEHLQAVDMLREQIRQFGGIADESSGAWGLWAKTVEGTANLFGDAASLKALKEGEEHGLKEYQAIMDDPDLLPEFKSLLTERLQLRQKEHIETLDRCIETLH